MSPAVSNNLIFGAIILFVVVSIASNTLNYLSVESANDSVSQNGEIISTVKNLSENTNKIAEMNHQLLEEKCGPFIGQ